MPGKTLSQVVAIRLRQLQAKYRTLAHAFAANGIPADKVYITQYFDPTHNRNGELCNPLLTLPKLGWRIDLLETRWAYENVITPMNKLIARTKKLYGWHPVGGIADAFGTHGYCTGNDSWIVQLTEALIKQHGQAGALHPNKEGHKAIALKVVAELKQNGIDGQLEH